MTTDAVNRLVKRIGERAGFLSCRQKGLDLLLLCHASQLSLERDDRRSNRRDCQGTSSAGTVSRQP